MKQRENKNLKKEVWLNFSNLLSISRLIFLPFFLLQAYTYKNLPSNKNLLLLLSLVMLIALSDFLDGYIARRLKQQTHLGLFLDPLCDKIFSISAFTLLLMYFEFPFWIYLIYVIRDIFGSVMSIFLLLKRNVQPIPNYWGKFSVGLSLVVLAWYFMLPLLKTYYPTHSLFINPEFLAYIWLITLLVSIYKYYQGYKKIIFKQKD